MLGELEAPEEEGDEPDGDEVAEPEGDTHLGSRVGLLSASTSKIPHQHLHHMRWLADKGPLRGEGGGVSLTPSSKHAEGGGGEEVAEQQGVCGAADSPKASQPRSRG